MKIFLKASTVDTINIGLNAAPAQKSVNFPCDINQHQIGISHANKKNTHTKRANFTQAHTRVHGRTQEASLYKIIEVNRDNTYKIMM